MRLLLFILFCMPALPLMAKQKEKPNCLLNIVIADGLELPQEINLELIHFDKNLSISSKLKLVGRTASFSKYIEEPVLVVINIKNKNKVPFSARFLMPVDTGTVQINEKNEVTINFKNQNSLFKNFSAIEQQTLAIRQMAEDKIKNISFEHKQMIVVQKEIDSINNHYERVIDSEIYKRTIDQHKGSFLGVNALTKYAERPFYHKRRKFQTDSLINMYDSFSLAMKALPSMKALHQLLIFQKSLNSGSAFPSFKLKDTSGRLQELPSFYGKYTLVDFWANWCTPCRDEHPNMISEYNKYQKQGFVILSISIDKVADQNLWRKAIIEDGVGLWSHFIDFEQKAKQQLSIRLIPSNFLLDESGRVIATDLRGDGLKAKLLEIFKK